MKFPTIMLGIPHLSLLIVKEKQQLINPSSIGWSSASFFICRLLVPVVKSLARQSASLEKKSQTRDDSFADDWTRRDHVKNRFVPQNAGRKNGLLVWIERNMSVFLHRKRVSFSNTNYGTRKNTPPNNWRQTLLPLIRRCTIVHRASWSLPHRSVP